jgi:beta-galactosidase
MRSSKAIISAALLSLVLFAFATPSNAAEHVPAGNGRIVESLDRDWTFQYFPQTAANTRWAQANADDSKWPAIALPHTWSVYETTRDVHPFIEHATERDDSYWWYGWGWYRKHFTIAQRLAQREVFLEFDGVQKVAFIYVNGHLAGEHRGGYMSFSLDVTRWINFGGENVIAVQVSNRRDDDLGHVPPMTAGNFDVYGGIYRSVRLVLTNKVHVPFQGSADSEGGDFIQTPHVSADSATVHDTTWVRNDGTQSAEVALRSQIIDADGRVLAIQITPATIAPGQLASIAQDFSPLEKPHLWSPSAPYLYRMVTAVLQHDVEVDRWESTFGLRFFSWNKAEKRLYLNGLPIQLIGTNRHQDFPWLGDAVPVWLQMRDLHDMRYNLGYNFQRTAHYTQDAAVYDFCDRNGIIVAEESPNIKDIDFGQDVQRQTLIEMIRRDRNHPSIFFWSIGNETDHPADSAWAWAEDQSRIVNLRRGTNGGNYVMTTEDDLALEQTLRCTIRGWYNDDAHNFSPGNGEPTSGQVTGTEEWQHTTDARYLLAKHGTNIVVFLYADHGADRIYKNAPVQNINPKGWVDDFRFPKYVYYLWQANFTQKPMVFIHPWPWQQPYVGKKEPITIDSNGDSVELLVDGKSLGVKHPSDANAHIVEFQNVEVTDGTIEAISHRGSQTATEKIDMPGAPVRLQLAVRDARLVADRSGLAVLDVSALDAKGEAVPYIHPEIRWSVEGEGRLVGPADYTTDTDKNNAASGTLYIDLPTANLIRTTNAAGDIRVTVSSPGLASASVTLHSTAPTMEGRATDGIEQPEVNDSGRMPVIRDRSIVTSAPGTPPRVFELIGQDYTLPAKSPAAARASIEEFLRDHNPKMPHDDALYEDVVQKLSQLLLDNHGNLVADWYNFTANQYEDVALLRAAIEKSGIAPEFRALLEKDYADRILLQGEAINATQEANQLAMMLARARVVSVAAAPPAGIEHVSAATLGVLLAKTYPQWNTMDSDRQKSLLELLGRFNPALRISGALAVNRPLPQAPIVLPAASYLNR